MTRVATTEHIRLIIKNDWLSAPPSVLPRQPGQSQGLSSVTSDSFVTNGPLLAAFTHVIVNDSNNALPSRTRLLPCLTFISYKNRGSSLQIKSQSHYSSECSF